VQEVEEWKAHCRDLIAAVGDLLALPDDESIPADVWGRLIDAYDALPFWMHHAKKYRNQEQLAAD
jgi:hypothetical protein